MKNIWDMFSVFIDFPSKIAFKPNIHSFSATNTATLQTFPNNLIVFYRNHKKRKMNNRNAQLTFRFSQFPEEVKKFSPHSARFWIFQDTNSRVPPVSVSQPVQAVRCHRRCRDSQGMSSSCVAAPPPWHWLQSCYLFVGFAAGIALHRSWRRCCCHLVGGSGWLVVVVPEKSLKFISLFPLQIFSGKISWAQCSGKL